MAKGAYIGVNNVARKVKKGYLGIVTDVPIYEETVQAIPMTAENFETYFTVTYGTSSDTHAFRNVISNGVFGFKSDNYHDDSATATTTWKAKVDLTVSFDYAVSSEQNFDKFSASKDGTTIIAEISGEKSGSWSGALSVGESITFKYAKDSSTNEGADAATISNINVTTVEKTIVKVETKPVARKIKKAYIGIGNVARPCWAGGELVYWGKTTPLSKPSVNLAATANEEFALFGGGQGITENLTAVNVYNSSLTQTNVVDLSVARYGLVAASNENYFLFGGGTANGTYGVNTVDAFNTSFVSCTVPTLSYSAKDLAATSINKYMLFGGGQGSTYDEKATVNAFDASLTRTLPSDLSQKRYSLAATSNGKYAFFGGGATFASGTRSCYTNVDVYTPALTRVDTLHLSSQRYGVAATHVGNYILFGGGLTSTNNMVDVVDVFDSSHTRMSPIALSVARHNLSATSVEGYALFGSGQQSREVVDAYDESLTLTTFNVSGGHFGSNMAATLKNYALFAGGGTTVGSYSSAVDAFTVV